MANKVIYSKTDDKGRTFQILGDLDSLLHKIDELEFNIDEVDTDHRADTNEGQFILDLAEMAAVLTELTRWDEVFEKIPRKKNGTFAKGRVMKLARMHSMSVYWEDSYGWAAPEIRLKTIDDFTAEVMYEPYMIEKY